MKLVLLYHSEIIRKIFLQKVCGMPNRGVNISRGDNDYMSEIKLQDLYNSYIKSSDKESIFLSIYEVLSIERDKNRAIITRSGFGNNVEALALFDDILLRLLSQSGLDSFAKTFTRSLKNARLNFFRDTKRRTARLTYIDAVQEEFEGLTPLVLQLKAADNVEDFVCRKKEADQRQLIDFLVSFDPPKVDPITTLIVKEFPQHKSITALAKALGLHHEVVKRKLRALSRHYDVNRFGDIRDYLAV